MSASPVHQATSDRPSIPLVPQSPIEKLDFDTLLRILEYAMGTNVELDSIEAYLSHRSGGISPTIHYLGRVSRAWHNLCTSTPSLWRTIIIFVDVPYHTHELQQLRLKTYLERSQPLIIRLYLCRMRRIPPSLDFGEAELVETAMSICGSHLERVEVLMVETNQASSLPCVFNVFEAGTRGLHSLARLKRLMLTSNVDDSILPLRPSSIPSRINQLFPTSLVLTSFYIDGRNLLLMLQPSKSQISSGGEDIWLSMLMLEELGVNNLTCCVDGFSIERIEHFFFDILPSFPRLRTFALDNFAPVPEGSSPIPGKPLLPYSISRVVIKRTKPRFIESVVRWVSPNTLVLIDCPFTSPLRLPAFSKLILVNITSDLDYALPKTISRWSGEFLEFQRCACVNDVFWAALQHEASVDEVGGLGLDRFKSINVVPY